LGEEDDEDFCLLLLNLAFSMDLVLERVLCWEATDAESELRCWLVLVLDEELLMMGRWVVTELGSGVGGNSVCVCVCSWLLIGVSED
jgi:hypothetical protein